jgi:hypothetical protein
LSLGTRKVGDIQQSRIEELQHSSEKERGSSWSAAKGQQMLAKFNRSEGSFNIIRTGNISDVVFGELVSRT